MGVEKQPAECSTNEYVFLLSKEKQLEQPLQGDTLRVG